METCSTFKFWSLRIQLPFIILIGVFLLHTNDVLAVSPPTVSLVSNITNGLAGWWTMDSVDATNNIADSSGHGKTLQLSSFTSTATVPGKIGQALPFNGSGEIASANFQIYDGSQALTLSAWVSSTDPSKPSCVIAAGSNIGRHFQMCIYANSIEFYSSNLTEYVSSNIPSTIDGLWHFYAITYANGTLIFYRDGAVVNSVTGLSWIEFSSPNDYPGLVIGNDYYGNYLNSTLDDVRVYDRALSGDEISSLYNFIGVVSSYTTATLTANIDNTGGSDAIEHGFAVGTSPDLTTNVSTTTQGSFSGTGSFTKDLTGLEPGTTYYFRAYTRNTTGIGYSGIQSFNTLSDSIPALTTSDATFVSTSTMTLNGSITMDGNASSTVRGFAWGTSSTLSDGDTATTTEAGTFGIGDFISDLTNLSPDTTYYFRAYAVNSQGTSTGVIFSTTTLDQSGNPNHPTVYFWSNGTDDEWTTIGNWWTNADHASGHEAGTLPTASDDVITVGTVGPNVDLTSWQWQPPTGIDATATGITFVGGGFVSVDIIGSTTFNSFSSNQGTIIGTTTFNDTCFNNGGTVIGNTTLNGSGSNFGTIIGTVVFHDDSYNDGTTTGTTTFNDRSHNDAAAVIIGPSFFNDNTANYGTTTSTTTFNDISGNVGAVLGTAIFGNATQGTITIPTGGAWSTGTSTYIVGSDLVPITRWVFDGAPTFSSNTVNLGDINGTSVTFNGTSFNFASNFPRRAIHATTTFNDSSFNIATIVGSAIFNDSSSNGFMYFGLGTVIGDATFNGDLSENGSSTVTGTKTRRYTTDVSPTRDFVSDGPWTIVADGAVVDLRGATYDTSGDASSTILEVTNCGSFVHASASSTIIGTRCPIPTPLPSPAPIPVRLPTSTSSSGGCISYSMLASILAPSKSATAYLDSLKNSPSLCKNIYAVDKSKTDFNDRLAISSTTLTTFTRNLKVGDTGSDVKLLQRYLNSRDFTISIAGAGSPGHETTTFGPKTKSALMKFQEANNITPAVGFFGPKTRLLMLSLTEL